MANGRQTDDAFGLLEDIPPTPAFNEHLSASAQSRKNSFEQKHWNDFKL
jgi:hypothetical protein